MIFAGREFHKNSRIMRLAEAALAGMPHCGALLSQMAGTNTGQYLIWKCQRMCSGLGGIFEILPCKFA
jgi:hypothetical protein